MESTFLESMTGIMDSINDALNLSEVFGIQSREPGVLVVEFVLSTLWYLLDASLDDEGLLDMTSEKKSRWPTKSHDMEIDRHDSCFDDKKTERHESMCKMNTIMAIELIGEFFHNKLTSRILHLAHRNMSKQCECCFEHLQLLSAKSSALRTSKNISPETLMQLTSDAQRLFSREGKRSSHQTFHAVMASPDQGHGTSHSAQWLPVDLFLEDIMYGWQVVATSAAETLTDLVKALQAINRTSWQDTFLSLWVSVLRLVQRERDSNEGPEPRLDTCLCLLLSITPIAILNLIEDEESPQMDEVDKNPLDQKSENQTVGKRRQDLISSLQQLDDYEILLTSPLPLSSVANQAAAKAMMYLSGITVGSGYFDGVSLNDMPINCSGNLRHLIVEACIARNVLDTSAYLWPGYVKGRTNQLPRSLSNQMSGWSSLIKGSPLTQPIVSALTSIPASSLAELEKIYEIALNGSDDERISAATIICGASLYRGWNIQEHTVLFITRLLSPPNAADYSGAESHLIGYAAFLNVLLVGIACVDCVQIFSLHGLVPQLAGALMPICEVFGSCPQTVTGSLPTGEEISPHAVFSNAFTLLLKLWRFDQTPIKQVDGDLAPIGSQLTPEFLLLVRNCQLASSAHSSKSQCKIKRLSRLASPTTEPVSMEDFPKLKHWYRQHLTCIASPLSGLVPGKLHQLVDVLLTMMFRRSNRGGQSVTTSNSSNSSGSVSDEISPHLRLPAWDILEAVPFVLDASLTAVAHGRLSPRELATGLKDLADFLPASLAAIVSYISAEVTRGLWKPASMNGSDWPSPAANLSMVEQQLKKILAATGVDVPSLPVGGSSSAILPLPLAALVSLTITYKLERSTDRFLSLVGPALSNLATSCPWPCMPIVAALWAQKVRRWSDFLVFNASRTVFHHNKDAVIQLLRVCFSSTLGLNGSSVTSNGGVGSLLGHGFSHPLKRISPVAPGILYLRVHRAVRNVMFMTEEIVSLLMHSVEDIANSGLPTEKLGKLKRTKHGMKYGHVSLAAAMTRVKLAASLGASLGWISGGLNLVNGLIKETLPSWFIATPGSEPEGGESGGMIAMLKGYGLAYFSVLSGMFAWGVDSSSPASRWRPKVVRAHMEFLASALDGKISLGCNKCTWEAYVSGFVFLIVTCVPTWMQEVDVEVLKRVSRGLKQWNEEELALSLLGISGFEAVGAAAEMIIESQL
ncbi:hypothetical protein Leryth_009044 [Lithospermum erythrorhizon]|nr:hypothetical protein Leryth_009044 [Lithospermum erythrorhizon]